jgi:ketosteroid isomerase-like protein
VTIARRAFDAFSRGDLEAVLEGLDPRIEFHPSGRFVDTQRVYRGREGYVEFWTAFRSPWKDIPIAIERIEELDDGRVLTLGTFHAKGDGSGVEVQSQAAWLVTIDDGLIVHIHSFATWAEALKAVGLSE